MHQPGNLEVIGELEAQNRIVDLFAVYPMDVLFRGVLLGILEVIGNSAAGQDGTQVHGATQFLSGFIQAPTQTISAIFMVDEHIQPVQGITIGVVPDLFVAKDQVIVGVGVAEPLVLNAYG